MGALAGPAAQAPAPGPEPDPHARPHAVLASLVIAGGHLAGAAGAGRVAHRLTGARGGEGVSRGRASDTQSKRPEAVCVPLGLRRCACELCTDQRWPRQSSRKLRLKGQWSGRPTARATTHHRLPPEHRVGDLGHRRKEAVLRGAGWVTGWGGARGWWCVQAGRAPRHDRPRLPYQYSPTPTPTMSRWTTVRGCAAEGRCGAGPWLPAAEAMSASMRARQLPAPAGWVGGVGG